MHMPVRQFLERLQADHPGDPLGFLWELAPVYEWWLAERARGTQPVGFLTFHRLVICRFGPTFPAGRVPVTPSSVAPYPAILAARARAVDGVGALQELSEDLEGWHNGVHEVGDPVRSVFQRRFWQFHLFLDQEFDAALSAMGTTFDRYATEVREADQRWV
jgi:hypothetical protein